MSLCTATLSQSQDGWVAENRGACCYFYCLSTPEIWPLCGLLAEEEAAKLQSTSRSRLRPPAASCRGNWPRGTLDAVQRGSAPATAGFLVARLPSTCSCMRPETSCCVSFNSEKAVGSIPTLRVETVGLASANLTMLIAVCVVKEAP